MSTRLTQASAVRGGLERGCRACLCARIVYPSVARVQLKDFLHAVDLAAPDAWVLVARQDDALVHVTVYRPVSYAGERTTEGVRALARRTIRRIGDRWAPGTGLKATAPGWRGVLPEASTLLSPSGTFEQLFGGAK